MNIAGVLALRKGKYRRDNWAHLKYDGRGEYTAEPAPIKKMINRDCPRCGGNLLLEGEEVVCLQCGWRVEGKIIKKEAILLKE